VNIGVLALQGGVREHLAALGDLGHEAVTVRRPADLDGLGGIVLPGGESTTLSLLLESSGLFGPLAAALEAGLPAFGTCAGLVLLADDVQDGRPDQRTFGRLRCTVRRNGYGRQLESFEATLPGTRLAGAVGDGSPLPAVFIRAPVVMDVAPGVEVLASLHREGSGPATPVVVRQGSILAATFHPELTADRRLHRLFLDMVAGSTPHGATPGRSGAVR
jgi:5'-phosphate synthase pdxT subunit